jgi:outer membrane PBP1 activator LpoA protein
MNNLIKLLFASNYAPLLLYFLLPGFLIFSGCTSMVSESAMPENVATPAEAMAQIGSVEATPEVQQPTPVVSAEQNQQHLQKIEDFIQAGDNVAAKNLTNTLNPLDLSIEQQALLNLLNAQILLGLGDPEMAIRWLAAILPEQLDSPHQIAYFQSQGFAYSLTGNALESAKSRIALNELLTSPKERDENQAAILESLSLLLDSDLDRHLSTASDSLAGWISLAKILKLKGQPGFSERVALWRENFPGHPANAAMLENAQVTPVENNFKQPTSIALLLPESGPFAEAAKAIRAGFMAAYNQPGSNNFKPSIHVYNTEQASALFLYNQAISEGSQFIIGPLQKETIQSLADSVTLQVPVLALNHVPGLEKDNLYQFGLSPIDDVEAMTHKAWLDGHRNALVLISDNAQGHRIASYFEKNWQDLGGTIVETQTYKPKETDFSEPIKKLLHLDESENRFNKIRESIPEIKFTPRRRQDADVLFLSANSFEARLINPQLHYYLPSPLPIYATSSIYSGQSNASLDADLNSITFCDTPWLLDKTYLAGLSKEALKDAWQQFPNIYLRLFAMGIDSYHLISRLKTLDTAPFAGATGSLSLVADNRIKRDLTCAKFIDGLPEMTDPVSTSVDSAETNSSTPEEPLDPQPVQENR